MASSPTELLKKTLEQFGQLNARMLDQGAEFYQKGMEQLIKTMNTNTYLMEKAVEGGLMPMLRSFFEMERDITVPFLETMAGKKDPDAFVEEIGRRMRSGGTYGRLVDTLGREIFGSATFEGETVLAEDDFFRLSFLPPTSEDRPFEGALFHVGGFLPYSDLIFRFLPEANLFDPFLARGVPVYALELKGPKEQLPNLSGFSMEGFIETIDQMSDVAFSHNNEKKLVMEGYCGLGLPAFSYLAALPGAADTKFKVAFTMVSPVDGRACELVGGVLRRMPPQMLKVQSAITALYGSYIPGDMLQMSMDIPIGTFFPKTPLGRFVDGWKNHEYADISSVEQLTLIQRRDLAGAFWISPENCRDYPLPVDMVKFSTHLWVEGVDHTLQLPLQYNDQPLNLHTIVDQTKIQLAGLYGGSDLIVPPATAHVLVDNLGHRYTLVDHPQAGHISYVMSPKIWNPENPRALDPNPIDLMLDLYKRG